MTDDISAMEYLLDETSLYVRNHYCPEVRTKSIGELVETHARRAITENGEVTILCIRRYIGIESCQ